MNDDLLPPLPQESSDVNANNSQEKRNLIADGPFGLAKGIKREEFDIALAEVQPCIFHAETLPKKHSAFQYYFMRITPVQGLAWIKAVGNNIQTNPYGFELKATFDEMKEKLQKIYGKPKLVDFLMHDSIWKETGCRHCRVVNAVFLPNGKTRVALSYPQTCSQSFFTLRHKTHTAVA